MGVKRRFAFPLFLVLAFHVIAKDKNPGTVVQGTVFLVDRNTSIIMVDTATGARHVVLYKPDTKFTYGRRNKASESTISEVHEHQYISCRGATDDAARLIATECVHRETR